MSTHIAHGGKKARTPNPHPKPEASPHPKPLGEGVPDALKNFDSLPDSANVRQPVVKALFACSDATVWRRVNAGLIPKPKKLGSITAWNVGELRAVLNGEAAK